MVLGRRERRQLPGRQWIVLTVPRVSKSVFKIPKIKSGKPQSDLRFPPV